MPKSYYNKAKDYLSINRSTYSKNYEILKKEASAQKRTTFEFCIWYDFQLVNVANLHSGIFSTILELIEKGYISSDKYIKNFHLACLLLSKFIQSNKITNDIKCEEYIKDNPDVTIRLNTKKISADFSSYLNYERSLANKQMFPFFRSKGIDVNLIAELISRGLLAFDTKFRNLIFINKAETNIIGVEKLGIGLKHFQRLEGSNPLCWNYWVERKDNVCLKEDIEKVIFFDNTIRLLQHLTMNFPQEGILYCSLHTDNCLEDTYTNTLNLLSHQVEIQFDFENQIAIERFTNINRKNDVDESEKNVSQLDEFMSVFSTEDEIRDTTNMRWIEEKEQYYNEEDDTYWNFDGTEVLPF